MKNEDISRKILERIRSEKKSDFESPEEFWKRKLNEEYGGSEDGESIIVVRKNDPKFSSTLTDQETDLSNTVGDDAPVSFKEGALKLHVKEHDVTLDGELPNMHLSFQFRYSDPSGYGCWIWTKLGHDDAFNLTDANVRIIGKLKNAYDNWKSSITKNGAITEAIS